MLFNHELVAYTAISKYKFLLYKQSELNNLDFTINHLPHIKAEDEFLKIEKDEAFILSGLQTSITELNNKLNSILAGVFDDLLPNWLVKFKEQIETVSKYINGYLDRASENYVNRYHYYLYLLYLTQNLTEELQPFKANFAYFISQSNPEKKIDPPREESEIVDPFITKNRDIIPKLFNFLDLYSLKSFTSVKKDLYALRKNELYISNFFKKGYPQEVSILDKEEISLPLPQFYYSNVKQEVLAHLFNLVKEGNLKLIEQLFKVRNFLDPFDIIRAIDPNKNTLLHWASYFKHQHILDFFYSHCFEYLSQRQGCQRRHTQHLHQLLIICNQKDAINQLMKLTSLDVLDQSSKKSFLHFAVEYGHVNLAAKLIDLGANIEQIDGEGNRPLQLAVKHGHLEVVKLLLNNFCNVLTLDFYKNCILEIATTYGHTNVVRFLLQHFSHVWQNTISKFEFYKISDEYESNTLHISLHLAAERGYPEIVDLLLQYSSKTNHFDSEKNRAMWEALFKDHNAVLPLLINNKADAYVTCLGQNLLEAALEKFAIEIYKLEPQYREFVNIEYTKLPSQEQSIQQLKPAMRWYKILHHLVHYLIPSHDLNKIMQILVNFIVQIDIKEPSLLHAAVIKDNLNVAEILIHLGVNINCTSFPHALSPLHYAVRTKNNAMIELLLTNGADINAIGYRDATKPALYFAVKTQAQDIAVLLLQNGANPDVLSEQDQTALKTLLGSKRKRSVEEESDEEQIPPYKKQSR